MKKNIFILILIVFVGLVSFQSATAQETPNLQNLNVDELSDAQIQKFIDQVESSGYSQQQLEALAKARGMSASQIAKLRQRISVVQSNRAGGGAPGSDISRARGQADQMNDPFASILKADSLAKKETDGLEIFGMSIFRNKYLTFEPSMNIATPKNYVIGSGDEIIIDVWGASEQTYQLEVSPDGNIVVPSIGPIYLNGLDFDRAEERIKYKLKSIYSTLGSNTFAQVSLGKTRTISINVLGEVQNPGTYQLSSFGTAFNALYLAGGPNKNGSFREIHVFRGGEKVATLDGYNFLVYGKGQNFMLQDQDVLLVRPYVNRIAMVGEVKHPAYYEMVEGESLAKALDFAGGFTPRAYKKSISLRRSLANRKTVQTVRLGDFENFLMQAGDSVTTGAIQNIFVDRVTIEGPVNHPGEYELADDMTLSNLVELADGFSPDVFNQRAVIIRQNPDFTLTTIAFSPLEVLNGTWGIALQSEDLVKIQSIFDMREELSVSIQGEVQDARTFQYTEGMTVKDLIFLAKGFKETAAKSFVEVARRITEQKENNQQTADLYNFPIGEDLTLDAEDANFLLEPYDLVVIRKSPYYQVQDVVEIEGEVLFPGKYVLNNKTERISDIIQRAGGFTDDAFPAGGTLIRETEYFDEGKAALVKRLRIQALGSYDSTAVKGTFAINREESIAIELDKILSNPNGQDDIILRDGDVISVPKELQTVRVRGEVYFSSNLIFRDAFSFGDYISQAGGSTEKAKIRKAYVVYPNGSAERTKSFLWFKDFPEVLPGSEIIIPRKPEKRKISPTEIISIASGIGTLALIINNLTR